MSEQLWAAFGQSGGSIGVNLVPLPGGGDEKLAVEIEVKVGATSSKRLVLANEVEDLQEAYLDWLDKLIFHTLQCAGHHPESDVLTKRKILRMGYDPNQEKAPPNMIPGSLWRHWKNNKIYRIQSIGRWAGGRAYPGGHEIVVYVEHVEEWEVKEPAVRPYLRPLEEWQESIPPDRSDEAHPDIREKWGARNIQRFTFEAYE